MLHYPPVHIIWHNHLNIFYIKNTNHAAYWISGHRQPTRGGPPAWRNGQKGNILSPEQTSASKLLEINIVFTSTQDFIMRYVSFGYMFRHAYAISWPSNLLTSPLFCTRNYIYYNLTKCLHLLKYTFKTQVRGRQGKRPLEGLRCVYGREVDIKMYFRELCRLDSFGTGQGPVAESRKHANEHSGSTKGIQFRN